MSARLALLLALAAGAHTATVLEHGPAVVGKPAPTFAGFDLSGTMVSSKEILHPFGKPPPDIVVLAFVASFCEPCVANLPVLVKAQSDHVRVVLVDTGETPDQGKTLLAGLATAPTCLSDPFWAVAHRFGLQNELPRTFVIDRDGAIRTIFVREGGDFPQALAAALNPLLQEEARRGASHGVDEIH